VGAAPSRRLPVKQHGEEAKRKSHATAQRRNEKEVVMQTWMLV